MGLVMFSAQGFRRGLNGFGDVIYTKGLADLFRKASAFDHSILGFMLLNSGFYPTAASDVQALIFRNPCFVPLYPPQRLF